MATQQLTTLLVLSLLAAPALARPRTLDIKIVPAPNPAAGMTVAIAGIEDARPRLDPEKKPGLIGIDFKGNEMWLPMPRTGKELIAEIVTKGFREAGYRVVASGDEQDATPVTVKIEEYWGHGKSGMVVYYNFDGVLLIKGDLPGLQEGARVEFHNTRGSWGANVGRRWVSSQQEGADGLTRALRDHLAVPAKPPAEGSTAPAPSPQ